MAGKMANLYYQERIGWTPLYIHGIPIIYPSYIYIHTLISHHYIPGPGSQRLPDLAGQRFAQVRWTTVPAE